MKKTAMGRDVIFLPHEIIRNILKRLPVKSLIRFQCVGKDWKNLIQNPSFIAEHLQQSTHENPSLLLESNEIDFPFPWRLTLLDCGLQIRGVQSPPPTDSFWDARIVGSCNGLLCVEIHKSNRSPRSLSLWNPATTAVRHVPRTRTGVYHFDDCVTGFGFSPIVNEYKIVRTYADFHHVVTMVTKVEVFSLNRGTWKAIDIGNLKGVRLKSETVTANGAIFWSGVKLVGTKEGEDNIDFQEDEDHIEEAEDKVDVIVSFDIAKEVFTLIPRPVVDYNADEKLAVYENKLAILCHIGKGDDKTTDLWVLDEGTCASGQTWSWTRRYTGSPVSCTSHSMTIWRHEIVCKPIMTLSLTKRYTSSLLSYSITSRGNTIFFKPNYEENDDEGRRNDLYMMNLTTNEVRSSVIPYCDSILRIYNYVESLVSVGNNYIEESW